MRSGKRSRSLLKVGALAALAFVALVLAPELWVYSRYNRLVYDEPSQVPAAPVAIVFGAGLKPDGSPSKMLADRVEAGVALYKLGKVQRLLLTGDNATAFHDEVTAMKNLALALGVPPDRIVLDPAGVRTYDSAYRARAAYGVDEAILVSQRYHLPRALYFAHSFGIKAVGLKAGRESYPGQAYYNLREAASLVAAWYEVSFIQHEPRDLGG